MPCCSCNGKNTVCKHCACVHAGMPCQNCLPLKMKCCCNTLSSHDDSQSDSSRVLSNQNSDLDIESVNGHVSLVAKNDLCDNDTSSAMYAAPPSSDRSSTIAQDGDDQPSDTSLDHMMMKAYGATLLHSDGGSRNSQWCQRWSHMIQHRGKHYSLPGGSIGKKYIDILSEELHYLSAGAFPSERVIVFCSVMLQCDRLIRKGTDIRRLLERHMAMWQNRQFDALLQEAARCDLSLRNSCHLKSDDSQDHLTRVFTRLMLQGNVCAAVHWITERSGGGVLAPSVLTEIFHTDGTKSLMSVFDVLCSKHPEPRLPKDCAIPSFDTLPCLRTQK